MTTDEQLAAIRERHAKMPEGDYTKREPHDDWGLVRRPDGWPFADVAMSIDSSTQVWGGPAPEFVEAKREFVANAVADIAVLLARIATLTAERDEANERRAETVAMCEQLTAELAAAKKRADECEDVIATTTDLANTWARESSVPEADGNVFSGFGLRELIDRLWVRANERWIKQVRRNDETTAELAAANADRERIAKFIDYCPAPGSIYDLATAVKDFVAGESKAAADARQAAIVAKLRADADAGDRNLAGLNRAMYPSTDAMIAAFRFAADAIERGEHEKRGGDG